MTRPHLGEFEILVLLAALRLGEDDAYAVSIVDEIESRTLRSVQRAAVYVVLQRLEKKGLIATRMSQPIAERGGKSRRLVTVIAPGLAALDQARTAFRSMWSGLDISVQKQP